MNTHIHTLFSLSYDKRERFQAEARWCFFFPKLLCLHPMYERQDGSIASPEKVKKVKMGTMFQTMPLMSVFF